VYLRSRWLTCCHNTFSNLPDSTTRAIWVACLFGEPLQRNFRTPAWFLYPHCGSIVRLMTRLSGRHRTVLSVTVFVLYVWTFPFCTCSRSNVPLNRNRQTFRSATAQPVSWQDFGTQHKAPFRRNICCMNACERSCASVRTVLNCRKGFDKNLYSYVHTSLVITYKTTRCFNSGSQNLNLKTAMGHWSYLKSSLLQLTVLARRRAPCLSSG
jgi:hypothetical protein